MKESSDQSEKDTVQELQETIEEIKDLWQRGETLEMPEPIERARALADDLDNAESDETDREDAVRGHVAVHDLYPHEELHERAIEDAAEDLETFDVPAEEAKIRYACVEDGVLHYKIEHENIPTIDYGYELPDDADLPEVAS